ncbi:MAG: hypothetical protein IPM81_11855 [Saprospirales bacterium]|nr:hypothetical protein [Saprospirales bacterium]
MLHLTSPTHLKPHRRFAFPRLHAKYPADILHPESIHRMVDETEDPLILKQVAALFESLLRDEDWWNLISEEEKRKIEIGMTQAAAGRTVPHETVREEAKRILKGETPS